MTGDITSRASPQKQQMSSKSSPAHYKQSSPNKSQPFKKPSWSHKTSNFLVTNSQSSYLSCHQEHPLYRCHNFANLSSTARSQFAERHTLCRNCLSSLHTTQQCSSRFNCRKCNKRHHTLLHSVNIKLPNISSQSQAPTTSKNNSRQTITSKEDGPTDYVKICHSSTRLSTTNKVLLATAIVHVRNQHGHWYPCRALLDSSSEATYVTTDCLKGLGLALTPYTTKISGFGNSIVNTVAGISAVTFRPRYRYDPTYDTSAIVVSQITRQLPQTQLPSTMLQQLDHFTLADPEFTTPAAIDMLIGADLYSHLLTGRKHQPDNGPTALETTLGWIVTGPVTDQSSDNINTLFITHSDPISETLTKFWELEEVPSKSVASDADVLAEHLFSTQHARNDSGRYIVPLLFKREFPNLGNLYFTAVRCYQSLLRRLKTNSTLREEYLKFMSDYLESGHMFLANEANTTEGFYLPHHPIFRDTGSTSKIRVVFNGSKKTSTNTSLNEELLPGPSLQADRPAIIMRSRFLKIIFTADIRQMYRQILMQDNHRLYQKILWSFNLSSHPDTYYLATVTYGTTCAPFLALRTLRQLALDEGESHPAAAAVLSSDTFVDDIVTGADTVEKALHLQRQLVELLSKVGLELRKWTSNCPAILEAVPEEHREKGFSYHPDENSVKILGLIWTPTLDTFSYQINLPGDILTKRSLLSAIARIFDPLGLLAPVTMSAKCLMQELWAMGLDWDAEVPQTIALKWKVISSQLHLLSHISVPRFIPASTPGTSLLGFCDASESGYAAVVYLRTITDDSQPTISLLIAKSKVAPLKRYFTELQRFAGSDDFTMYIATNLARDGITWHLNPPSAPHFGGLWEAAIKSVKFHISRVIGHQILTYEEFSTILCQIEAILNSRPLSPLSADPNDLGVLTPNHFLMQEPAVCLADHTDFRSLQETHLSRWQLVQRMQQDFWSRWKNEHLSTFQARTKWTKPTPQISVGTLVLIKDIKTPSMTWPLGRVIQIYPGSDDITRVAQVKTANGTFTRPVVKLCLLPLT